MLISHSWRTSISLTGTETPTPSHEERTSTNSVHSSGRYGHTQADSIDRISWLNTRGVGPATPEIQYHPLNHKKLWCENVFTLLYCAYTYGIGSSHCMMAPTVSCTECWSLLSCCQTAPTSNLSFRVGTTAGSNTQRRHPFALLSPAVGQIVFPLSTLIHSRLTTATRVSVD